MRAILIAVAALLLSGCVTNPAQQAAHEEALGALAKARTREVDLIAENLALKHQVEKLAQEVGEAQARITSLTAQLEAAAATRDVERAAPAVRPTSSSKPAAVDTPSSSRGSGEIHTGPRGGQYRITPSGNKSYIRRR